MAFNPSLKLENEQRRIERLYVETQSQMLRDWYFSFMMETTCTTCKGKRLNEKPLSVKIDGYGAKTLAEELNIGLPTLQDIVKELAKPGRDIRDELPPPLLRKDILDIKDLKEGMEVTGTVRNVVDFGAFIDLGVHHDGLVHISQISDKFIRHPSEMLSVGQVVTATVLSVDLQKNRIALTLKKKS